MTDDAAPLEEPGDGNERKPYASPDIVWIENVEVKRNLSSACTQTDSFSCSDGPSS